MPEVKYLYGIQPTGRIHLGNYLGGLKLAIEKGAFVMIADLHAWTKRLSSPVVIDRGDGSSISVSASKEQEKEFEFEEFLKSIGAKTYRQEELSPILSWKIQCVTPTSDLERMTQWKDKGKGNTGLLTYPCLMAADIILSGCDVVIVGEDQLQHMEFYRRTCKRIGIKKVAKTLLTETPRIMSIKDPTKKMSKSLGDAHCLYLGDHEANRKKIMKAPTTTDGIKNLKQVAKGLGIKYDEKNNKESKELIIKALSEI